MKERALANACKERGFTKCGKSYMRVIGNGVFQHISFGVKERLHTEAPGYSQFHRFEPRILIFLKSMYAQYDDLYISIDSTPGFSFTVPRLLDKHDTPFMGTTVEMERLLNEGLDVLDLITEQDQIVEYLEPLMNEENSEGPRYSTQLYDIYLYCEEFYKARMAIQTEFAENYFSTMSTCKVNPGQFTEKMNRLLNCAESYYERDRLTFPVHYEAAKARLQNNYEVNSCRLRELGIQLP